MKPLTATEVLARIRDNKKLNVQEYVAPDWRFRLADGMLAVLLIHVMFKAIDEYHYIGFIYRGEGRTKKL